MPSREIKEPCKPNCVHHCTTNFSLEERKNINASFWMLKDDEKPRFYCKFVKQDSVKRRRNSESTTKKNSYKFYLKSELSTHRVYKKFFLNTLSINEKRIYYYFRHCNDPSNGCPKQYKKGKNVKRVTSRDKVKEVHDHINMFPIVDSHYCRASSTKNISKVI